MSEGSYYERIGGAETLSRVMKIFYDKIFEDPWMSQYFIDVDQQVIESQQADFMRGLFGGPKNFMGRAPIEAHENMMVTEELFNHRSKLLEESLVEFGVNEADIKEWLRIDRSFKRAVIKKSADQCKKRWNTDEILDFPNPDKFKQSA